MSGLVHRFILWISMIGFMLIAENTSAQQVKEDTIKSDLVHIIHSDEIAFKKEGKDIVQKLRGNVKLYKDSTFFYCDSAIILGDDLWAEGNIQIIQGDSTSIFADSLYYSGEEDQAELYGEVALNHENNELYSDELIYNLTEKRASYYSGAQLIKGSSNITSKRGYYYLENKMAYFKDTVIVVDSNFTLKTDSLQFNTASQTAVFKAPTSIEQDPNLIYCESGYYDLKNRKARFRQNAAFVKSDQKGEADEIWYDDSTHVLQLIGRAKIYDTKKRATADRIVFFEDEEVAELSGNAKFRDEKRKVEAAFIRYDQKNDVVKTSGQSSFEEGSQQIIADDIDYDDGSGMALASGSVTYRDTANDLAIHCDQLIYDKETEYIQALGDRPWMEVIMDSDTMFVSADTLISTREIITDSVRSDTIKHIHFYNDVRIYKSDMQALCDSLAFSSKDSVFTLYVSPVLWSDTSQFTADTMRIFLKERKIDRLKQIKNALIINSDDLVYFNQIQGKWVTSYFKSGSPQYTIVEGNAESIYFGKDEDDAYIGGNQSLSSKIRINFEEKKIREIVFLTLPKAEMLPMGTPGLAQKKLEGFVWRFEERPLSKKDILELIAE